MGDGFATGADGGRLQYGENPVIRVVQVGTLLSGFDSGTAVRLKGFAEGLMINAFEIGSHE